MKSTMRFYAILTTYEELHSKPPLVYLQRLGSSSERFTELLSVAVLLLEVQEIPDQEFDDWKDKV